MRDKIDKKKLENQILDDDFTYADESVNDRIENQGSNILPSEASFESIANMLHESQKKEQ
jgi:hypothetical protein